MAHDATPVPGMNPIVLRGLVLASEILVFLVVTVVGANFISHAAAYRFGESEAPTPEFPVVVFEGDRTKPDANNYSVVHWNEWQRLAEKRPNASLLLPERNRNLEFTAQAHAVFSVSEGDGAQQTVELKWVSGEREQVAVYSARAREIQPRYLRSSGINTFLMAALLGFFTGVMTGKALRRYLLPRAAGPHLTRS